MRRFASIILALAAAAGCSAKGQPAAVHVADPVDVEDVAINYLRLTAMTSKPVLVNPQLAMLCRGATTQDVEAASKTFGPHANMAVMIYMSESAAGAFRSRQTPYPVGSVIVKQKKAMAAMQPNGDALKDGVGGMIKRAPGYDPTNGDWDYFYFPSGGKIEHGKITSCVQCHAGAAAKDHVFGGWAGGE